VPQPTAGQSVKVFALKNREAAGQANRRLENDAAFYRDVQSQFSK
jgi:hypothetical protein